MQTARLLSRLKNGLRTALGPVLPWVRAARSAPARLRAKRLAADLHTTADISVCYVTRNFPARPATRHEIAHGGEVKMTLLAEVFPHSYPQASLLYTVSSVGDVGKIEVVSAAKKNGLKVILNQNGVAFPAWHGPGWEAVNNNHKAVYQQADFIIFQSEFCQRSAREFLGETSAPAVILFNPVDIQHYQPRHKPAGRAGPVLLLGGNQYEQYRFESAALAFKETLRLLPEARLMITGKLWGESQAISMDIAHAFLCRLGIEKRVDFTGPYSQQDAPKIFGQADILIHTKYNDPSPNLISEALACGLPVVYSKSGGTPELVGEAGIGVEVEQSWENTSRPDPMQMAFAIKQVWSEIGSWSTKARARAESTFSLSSYTQEHVAIFTRLVKQAGLTCHKS